MTYTKLAIGQTIGIIGGGQLGKMMAQSAQRMGFKVAVLDPDETCPAKYVAHHFVHAAYNDEQALKELAEHSDCITYEFENISGEALETIITDYNVPQGAETVVIVQNRLTEKEAVKKAGAKLVPYAAVTTMDELKAAAAKLRFPFILKTAFGGYDGKGQLVMRQESDLTDAEAMISAAPCVAEQMIRLQSELSITATASQYGSIVFYPVQVNEHRNQMLYKTTVSDAHPKKEEAIAEVKKIAEHLHFVGTFTVEFFVDDRDELYVNEIAPRPHNSGHYSIEACNYSQFDTHILAVAGWQLPQEIVLHQPAVMYNLLGQDLDVMADEFYRHPEWHLHLYGKAVRKKNRKMGHVTILNIDNDYEAIYEERIR